MCKNCDVVDFMFQVSEGCEAVNFKTVHAILLYLLQKNRLVLFAADVPFDQIPAALDGLRPTLRCTIYAYLECPVCHEIYLLATCRGQDPFYMKIDNAYTRFRFIDQIEEMLWGREGYCFRPDCE